MESALLEMSAVYDPHLPPDEQGKCIELLSDEALWARYHIGIGHKDTDNVFELQTQELLKEADYVEVDQAVIDMIKFWREHGF